MTGSPHTDWAPEGNARAQCFVLDCFCSYNYMPYLITYCSIFELISFGVFFNILPSAIIAEIFDT